MKIFMVAGEASGDLLGGELLTALRQRRPDLIALGVGGSRMRAAGQRSSHDLNELSVIGLAEVLHRLPSLIRIFRDLVRQLRDERPALLITIDLPDFNFMLAKQARKLGIRVVHYVSPQVWAWRSGRVDKIARLVDHLLVLFPFEPALYAHTSLPVTFVGHPLAHSAQPKRSREQVRHDLGIAAGAPLIAVLPGSRHGEIARLLATMMATCQQLKRELGAVRFVLALADTLTVADLRAHWPEEDPDILIRQGETYDLVAAADVALVASGTATLETALLGTPMVVVYRVNRLTYWIGRRVIRVPFIALANLVAGEAVVPERIQDEANPTQLTADLRRILEEPEVGAGMRAGYQRVREKLLQPINRSADVVEMMLYK